MIRARVAAALTVGLSLAVHAVGMHRLAGHEETIDAASAPPAQVRLGNSFADMVAGLPETVRPVEAKTAETEETAVARVEAEATRITAPEAEPVPNATDPADPVTPETAEPIDPKASEPILSELQATAPAMAILETAEPLPPQVPELPEKLSGVPLTAVAPVADAEVILPGGDRQPAQRIDRPSPASEARSETVEEARTAPSETPPTEPASPSPEPTLTVAAAPPATPAPAAAPRVTTASTVTPRQPSPAATAETAPNAEPPEGQPATSQVEPVQPAEPAHEVMDAEVAEAVTSTAPERSLKPPRRPQKVGEQTAAKPAAQPPQPQRQSGNADQNARQGQDRSAPSSQSAARSGQGRAADGTADRGSAAAAGYGDVVHRKIRRTRRARVRDHGETVVVFSVAPSGQISQIGVATSSGSPRVDAAALDHVRRAAPFPPPPKGARTKFSVPISFRR